MQTPSRPQSARTPRTPAGRPHDATGVPSRPQSAKQVISVIATHSGSSIASPYAKSPLRRPRSAIGRSMAEHLAPVFDAGMDMSHGDHSPERRDGSRSPSPRRKALREEFERETEFFRRGEEEQRSQFCVAQGHLQAVRGICVLGDMAYTGSMDGTVKAWDLSSLMYAAGPHATAPKPVRTLPGNPSGISCLTLMDERYLSAGGWDADVRVWDLANDARALKPFKGHSEFVRAVAGRNGLLFSGGNDRTIRVWDVASEECLGMMAGHTLAVLCLAVASDGRRLFSGGYDFLVKVWDVESRQCVADLGGHTQVVTALAVLPPPPEGGGGGGRRRDEPAQHTLAERVLSCSEDGSLRVWDAARLECLAQFPEIAAPPGPPADAGGAGGGVPGAAELPSEPLDVKPWAMCADGAVLHLGTRDGGVVTLDLQGGRTLAACGGHAGGVRAVAPLWRAPYAHSLILSASDDGSVRAWKNAALVRQPPPPPPLPVLRGHAASLTPY